MLALRRAAKSIGAWEIRSRKFFWAGENFQVNLGENKSGQFTVHRFRYKIFLCQNMIKCTFQVIRCHQIKKFKKL